jgi:hypothetical protein
MLQVIFPVTLIFGSIDMSVDTITVCFVILPLAVKYVSVYMPEFPLAVSLVIDPLAFVPGTIWPDLDTDTVTYCTLPLTLIDGTILEFVFISLFEREAIIYLILFIVLISVLGMASHSITISVVLLIQVIVKGSSSFKLMSPSLVMSVTLL